MMITTACWTKTVKLTKSCWNFKSYAVKHWRQSPYVRKSCMICTTSGRKRRQWRLQLPKRKIAIFTDINWSVKLGTALFLFCIARLTILVSFFKLNYGWIRCESCLRASKRILRTLALGYIRFFWPFNQIAFKNFLVEETFSVLLQAAVLDTLDFLADTFVYLLVLSPDLFARTGREVCCDDSKVRTVELCKLR